MLIFAIDASGRNSPAYQLVRRGEECVVGRALDQVPQRVNGSNCSIFFENRIA